MKMTIANPVTDKEFIETFKAAMDAARDDWIQAGRIYLNFKLANPRAREILLANFPGLDGTMLDRLEQLARGQLLPALLSSSAPGNMYLSRLPIELQKKYSKEGIETLTIQDGAEQIYMILPEKMTGEQAYQVFSGRRVRTITEQRDFLARSKQAAQAPHYESRKDGLFIRRSICIPWDIVKKLAKEH